MMIRLHSPELYNKPQEMFIRAHCKLQSTARNGEVLLLPSDASDCQFRRAGDGARCRRVREGSSGPDGAHAGSLRIGYAESPCEGPSQLLLTGAEDRPQPALPLRGHAVKHRKERRRQAGSRNDDPQALCNCESPCWLQVWTIYLTMKSKGMESAYHPAIKLM